MFPIFNQRNWSEQWKKGAYDFFEDTLHRMLGRQMEVEGILDTLHISHIIRKGIADATYSQVSRVIQVAIRSPSLNLFIIFHEKQIHQRLTLYLLLGKNVFFLMECVFRWTLYVLLGCCDHTHHGPPHVNAANKHRGSPDAADEPSFTGDSRNGEWNSLILFPGPWEGTMCCFH